MFATQAEAAEAIARLFLAGGARARVDKRADYHILRPRAIKIEATKVTLYKHQSGRHDGVLQQTINE